MILAMTSMFRMLDPHMQYTCAYFEHTDTDLSMAQLHKMELIARKLNLRPGLRVVDLGCGWGGLANYLSLTYKVHVLGVSLSKEQIRLAKEKYAKNPYVEYQQIDYRHVPQDQPYDRVVSIGLIEHVGPKNYDGFFRIIHRLLKPDGIALVHGIGTYAEHAETSRFITKYIFPGGYIPRFKQLTTVIPKIF